MNANHDKAMAAAEKMRKALGVLYQRAVSEDREGDAVDVKKVFTELRNMGDELHAMAVQLQFKSDALDEIQTEHDKLLNAVLKSDESHALISELAETIRKEEWAAMEQDGVLTPNELMDKLIEIGLPVSQEEAALFSAWMTGLRGAPDGASARLLAEAIRAFLGVRHERD